MTLSVSSFFRRNTPRTGIRTRNGFPARCLAGRDHGHGVHARRRQGGVFQRGNENPVVVSLEIVDIVDEQFNGLRAFRNGLRFHPQVEEEQVQGRLEVLGPGHALRGDVPGLDELAVQVPYGGVGDHVIRHDFRAVGQAHTVGPPASIRTSSTMWR